MRRGRRVRRRRPRPAQRGRGVRLRPGPGRVPQAQPAQLRRVRRAAVLRPRHGRLAARRGRRRAGGRVDLRGRLQPDRPHRHPGRRRRRAGGQHQRLAVLRQPAGRARAHAGDAGVRRVVRPRVREPGRRPGRAGLRRRLDGVRRPRRACWPAPASSPRRRWSATSRCCRCSASACSTPGAGPSSRRSRSSTCRPRPGSTTPTTPVRARSPTRCRPCSEVYEALVTGTRDYVHKNGFTDVAVALVGRHRLVARGRHRRRRRRPRARPRRAHAVALLVRPLALRRREAGRRAGHRAPGDPHRARARRAPRHAGAQLRGPRAPTSPRRTCSRASAAS